MDLCMVVWPKEKAYKRERGKRKEESSGHQCKVRARLCKKRKEKSRGSRDRRVFRSIVSPMDTTSRYRHGLSTSLRLFVLSSLLVGAAICEELADTYHTIEVSSLLPSSSCESAPAKGNAKTTSLRLAHKRGPCAPKGRSDTTRPQPTHAEILQEDQSRVDLINSRLTSKTASVAEPDRVRQSDANIPARSGQTVGSGNYVVTVGLGTPKRDLSLIFDTGSDLTWTQCKPCVKYCYQQKEPVFDSTASTSYLNVSCTSASCSQLSSATGNSPGCSSTTCVYGIQYGDSSYSIGFFGKEKLTLTPTDTFDNFMFGCGQNNRGLFGGAAGLLGLGRDRLSIVEQTATKYGRYFSYCLPSKPSGTGHLTFGKSTNAGSVKFTSLSTISQGGSFYGITIEGITVGGQKLSIPASTFSNAPAIIDSGTVISRLPPTMYTALRNAFRQHMTKYPTAPALSILDTCYDLSSYSSADIPKVGFSFGGAVYVNLDPTGILYPASPSQVCLAFAGNGDDTDVLIYGNVQQQTFEIVYDVGAMKLGFGPGGCA